MLRGIAFLKNPIQEYDWGSRIFIPQLLDQPFPVNKPQAELWMGTHPKAPSQVLWDGQWIPLSTLIRENPEEILGKSVAETFGHQLPFLFKVLAAAKPLSIQAHPNIDQAREGFALENRLKIPLTASHRNYKDENHKPELICALSPFWALKGFRSIKAMTQLLSKLSAPPLSNELIDLQRQPSPKALRNFFNKLMTMDKERQRLVVPEMVKACRKHANEHPEFDWMVKLGQEYPGDIGVLSPIFLNLLQLQPGEAVYVQAGELHAYLEGAGIELMANSDNVLRGGLTAKHVDITELFKILDFTPCEIDILRPEMGQGCESVYSVVAKEFVLSVISVNHGTSFESPKERGVEIIICIEGAARVKDLSDQGVLFLAKGRAMIIPAIVGQYRIEGKAVIYKAAVPL